MRHAISRARMPFIYGVLALILGTPLVGYGQTRVGANCTIKWQANTETDLAGYRLYGTQGGATKTLDIPKPTTTSSCAALGVQGGGPITVEIDAVDDVGNRSPKATPVQAVQDITGPTQPIGLSVTPNP